jgi:SAM-dependent MidA family methyltransferase
VDSCRAKIHAFKNSVNSPSSIDLSPGASPEFLAAFRTHADAGGTMTFAQFVQLALYHPALGYYQRPQRRVGYEAGTDFFTASTSGAVFGELVAAACVALLGNADPHEHTFVEIGAEPAVPEQSPRERIRGDSLSAGSGGVLAGVNHPFAAVHAVGFGKPIRLAGKCVVFSNELFDSQPFHRFVFRKGTWRELGVQLRNETLRIVELPTPMPVALPEQVAEGYVLDLSLAARALAKQVAREPWTGLFVAADYGKSWRELIEDTPGGTARAYFRHTQSNDLLARPGEQDLTCHVCWDWLAAALLDQGFDRLQIESQEAFFIHHAGEFIAATSAEEAGRFSRRKLSLLQLLHPSHLGQKFQVLHALRSVAAAPSRSR